MKGKVILTDRDKDVLNIIYKVGFATIRDIAKLYFNNNYDHARIRLKKLADAGRYIKAIRNIENERATYKSQQGIIYIPIDSSRRKIKRHDLKLMEYISNFAGTGIEVVGVARELKLDNAVIDALLKIKYTKNNKEIFAYQLIEIQCRHAKVDVDRLESKKVLEEILEATAGYKPKLIIIQDANYDYKNRKSFDVCKIKTDFKDFYKIIGLY